MKWRTYLMRGYTTGCETCARLCILKANQSGGGDNWTMGNEGERKFGRLNNIANIGDIVSIEGEELGVFQVESWSHQVDYQPDYIDELIMYDVTDLRTHQFFIAFQEDISVVCRADKADEYLRNLGISGGFSVGDIAIDIGNMSFSREEDESLSKPIEMTKQERIDRLLDEINDYADLIRNFGDEDGEYQKRIDSAKRRLAIIAEGGR